MMISKIEFYDMDGCLILSPLPETHKHIWLEKTGEVYPHIGWWGRKESLDMDVFDIQPNEAVLKRLQDIKPNVMTVLLTNRQIKLESEVNAVLNKHEIRLDHVTLKSNNRSKGQRIEKFILEHENITDIDFYDDMISHFDEAKFLIEKYPNIKFTFLLVENNNITIY